MWSLFKRSAAFVLVFLLLGITYEEGDPFCVIFPPNNRDIFGVGQRSILIFSEGEVSLIPQVHFEGNARDFGILIPVPARPALETVGATIFSEASFLTQPLVRRTSPGCGCGESDPMVAPQIRALGEKGALVQTDENGGVTVIYEQIVGVFDATVLQASNASVLTRWLNENGYHYNPADTSVFDDYIARNWYWIAMKLDTSQVPEQIGTWWSASTNPARIRFAYSDSALTYPLKISAISAAERTDVLVYTIAPTPMRFPGAKVEYANAVDAEEAQAIRQRYLVFGSFVHEGVFITKLRRNFSKIEMQRDVQIYPSTDRSEFREITYASRQMPWGIAGGMIFLLAWISIRQRKHEH